MPKRAMVLLSCVLLAGWISSTSTRAPLPNRAGTVKFAVIGDNGTGDAAQYQLAEQMVRFRRQFSFDLVLMLGDNFYGAQRPADLVLKFDRPYKLLLDAGVRFQAALGNHDEPDVVNYPPLSMDGQRYYSFVRGNVRFFVLDTNSLDPRQLQWMERALQDSRDDWKIAYFHHPLYSNAGRHGASVDIRLLLEPLLTKYGVNVVFSGHDHVYERIKPQKGITYFVCGSGGKLRKGDLTPSDMTAAGFDEDQVFTLVEVDVDELLFETISRAGATVDAGVIGRSGRSQESEARMP
jgi:predicted MPP superfamily phosphohydrolase